MAQNEARQLCSNPGKKKLAKKEIWINNNNFLLDYLKIFDRLDSGYVYFRVPIVIHIYLNPHETQKRLLIDIQRVIQRLNAIYATNKTGIQFYLAQIIFLQNNRHLKANYLLEAPIISSKDQYKHAINVYYVNVLEQKFLFKKSYYHGVYNSLTKSIIIIRHASRTTLAHEIGHFFGLKHTHENWKKSKNKQECVSRTRQKGIFKKQTICEVNGDGLSDTPAEPNLTGYTNKECQYTGTLTDAWSEPYEPHTNNMMSYPGHRECRTNFTPMQRAVMLYTATNNKFSELWCTADTNKHLAFDQYEPDDFFETSAKLNFGEKQHHTFHKTISSDPDIFVENNLDFLFFIPQTTKTATISIQKGENKFPNLTLEVFDSNKKLIKNYEINAPAKFQLDVKKEKFYIKIQNKSRHENNQIFDYYIELLD